MRLIQFESAEVPSSREAHATTRVIAITVVAGDSVYTVVSDFTQRLLGGIDYGPTRLCTPDGCVHDFISVALRGLPPEQAQIARKLALLMHKAYPGVYPKPKKPVWRM